MNTEQFFSELQLTLNRLASLSDILEETILNLQNRATISPCHEIDRPYNLAVTLTGELETLRDFVDKNSRKVEG